jgi:hypothetical protein
MKTKEYCNNLYRDLIAHLGELYLQQNLLTKQIESILAKLELLNALSPELQKLEAFKAADALRTAEAFKAADQQKLSTKEDI